MTSRGLQNIRGRSFEAGTNSGVRVENEFQRRGDTVGKESLDRRLFYGSRYPYPGSRYGSRYGYPYPGSRYGSRYRRYGPYPPFYPGYPYPGSKGFYGKGSKGFYGSKGYPFGPFKAEEKS
jgi:hypothetical protein